MRSRIKPCPRGHLAFPPYNTDKTTLNVLICNSQSKECISYDQGHSYTQKTTHRASVHFLLFQARATPTLMHNSESKATTFYTDQAWPFLHPNTTQRAKHTYHTGQGGTLKHNSKSHAYTTHRSKHAFHSGHGHSYTKTQLTEPSKHNSQSIATLFYTGHSYTKKQLRERVTTTGIFTQHI